MSEGPHYPKGGIGSYDWNGIGRLVPEDTTAKLLQVLREVDAAKQALQSQDAQRRPRNP